MRRPSDVAAYSALTVAAFVWGGSIVGQKIALDAFSAVETSVLRGIGALAILIPLWWWQEGLHAKFAPRDMLVLAGLGMGVLGNHLLTLLGLRYIGAAAAGVIIGASPAITAFLSALLIRDVPFTTVAGGCFLSFAGVALVSGYGGEAAGGSNPWIGGVLVLLGLMSWSLYTIGGRRIMERFSPLTVNWTTLLISLVVQVLGQRRIFCSSEWMDGDGLPDCICHGAGPAGLALWSTRHRAIARRCLCEPYPRIGVVTLRGCSGRADWSERDRRHCIDSCRSLVGGVAVGPLEINSAPIARRLIIHLSAGMLSRSGV
jgi:hypothetical protein